MTIEDDRLTLDISDDGPGIEDIARAMLPGYSTASDDARELGFGAGMGLPNMQRNADEFFIESEFGRGTRRPHEFPPHPRSRAIMKPALY